MTYATVMVNLQLGRSNANLVQVAGDLAERFGSGVIGIAACHRSGMDSLGARVGTSTGTVSG